MVDMSAMSEPKKAEPKTGLCMWRDCQVRGLVCEWNFCPEHCDEVHHVANHKRVGTKNADYDPLPATLLMEEAV